MHRAVRRAALEAAQAGALASTANMVDAVLQGLGAHVSEEGSVREEGSVHTMYRRHPFVSARPLQVAVFLSSLATCVLPFGFCRMNSRETLAVSPAHTPVMVTNFSCSQISLGQKQRCTFN